MFLALAVGRCSASIFAADYAPCYLCSSTFSEGHMYSSHEGPLRTLAPLGRRWAAMTNGLSTVTARFRVTPPHDAAAVGSHDLSLAVAFYRVPEHLEHSNDMPDVCMASLSL